MDKDKEKQEVSVIGRLFSIEALLLLMGLASLILGTVSGKVIQIFWGVMIVSGAIVLHFVRKKDWKKHWEEQEAMKLLYEQRLKEKKERENADK
ncbi:MAG: hypothetical protein CXR31_11145 [Geobacter sp.]|nr:MAG: hypothetical protein CXR31_11145 [Geobacter sp.]